MINAVLMFAFITAIGETILIAHLNPKFRSILLNQGAFMLHISFAALNLWIHWGTMTGSMTAVTAFVVSVGVCKLMRKYYARRSLQES